MGLILCIETGTEVCSVCLSRAAASALPLKGAAPALAVRESMERDHSRQAAVFVDEVLRDSGVRPEELDAVAIGRGPGSYTGLRIGTSLAKGLCYGLDIPLIAINSMAALAELASGEGLPSDALLCPMLDARRMEVYAQVFDASGHELTPVVAEVVTCDSFREWRDEGRTFVIFGPGASKCREVLPDAVYLEVVPSSLGLTRLAHAAFAKQQFEDVAYYEPFYLKEFTSFH